MEFFKFDSVTQDGYISGGSYINGIRTARWTERYRDPGEFEFKSPVSAGLRTSLPVGSLISHVETREVMFVKSHYIDESVTDREPDLVITGNSLDAWLKHRSVGDDIETYVLAGDRLFTSHFPHQMAMDQSWAQAVTLFDTHITNTFAGNDDDIPGWVAISNQQHIGPETVQPRIIKHGPLDVALRELLAVDDFGIKVVRPNSGNVDPTTTEFRIHNGVDRTADVIFSFAFGDLENAEYFWTDDGMKTEYFCVSTYFELRSAEGPDGFDRRILYVDCTDIDGHLSDTEVFTAAGDTDFGNLMDIRGQQALRSQQAKALLGTDISKSTRYVFRTHYDVGDIVIVNGNHDVSSIMRVTEHVEFQDENGESGYPTLSALNE